MSKKELLSIFDLEPGASWYEVCKSYSKLIQEWRPEHFAYNRRLSERAKSFTQQLNNAFGELERIYVNGAWSFTAESAFGHLENSSNESDLEDPLTSPVDSKTQPWSVTIAGIEIDSEIVTLSLGLSIILFLPILVIMHGAFSIGKPVIALPATNFASHFFQSGLDVIATYHSGTGIFLPIL